MLSVKSKLHYEKVLGPSRLFDPDSDSEDTQDEDSEFLADEKTTVLQ